MEPRQEISIFYFYSIMLFVFVFIVPSNVRMDNFEASLFDAREDKDLALCLFETRSEFDEKLIDLEGSKRTNYAINIPIVLAVETLAGRVSAALAASALSWAVEQDNLGFEKAILKDRANAEADCLKRSRVTEPSSEFDLPALLEDVN